MKMIKKLLMLSALVITFTSCKKEIFGIKGKGNIVSVTRSVSDFDKIDLSINADLEYRQDSVYYLEIQAQSNIISNIDTDVDSDGELEIDFDDWVRSHKKIKIIIHSPEITRFKISGSGNIKALSAIETNEMETEISGSGDIELASLTANSLESDISGSGSLKISGGSVTRIDVEVSGSGKVEVEPMATQTADINVSGSGNMEVNCTSELNVKISGSGTVYYSGNPVIYVDISGSGDLIHL